MNATTFNPNSMKTTTVSNAWPEPATPVHYQWSDSKRLIRFPDDLNSVKCHNVNFTELWVLSQQFNARQIVLEQKSTHMWQASYYHWDTDGDRYRIKYSFHMDNYYALVYYIKKHKIEKT